MQGFLPILAYFPAPLTLLLWLCSFLYKGFSFFQQALINCVFCAKRMENGDIAIRDGRGGYEQVARDHSRRQDNLSSHSR